MREHTEFECPTCWRLFATEDEAGACCAPRPKPVAVYTCERCGMEHTDRATVERHEAAHAGEDGA